MEVPLRPCALKSALAASRRRERMLWPAVRVARALWRGMRRPEASGRPRRGRLFPLSLALVNRRASFPDNVVCISYKPVNRKPRFPPSLPCAIFREAGGLMSHGASLTEAFRQMGLQRPRPQGRQAGRPAGGAVDEV